MKRIDKIITMLLAAATILSLSAMASFSPEEVVIDRALEEITGLYTDVYTISDASAYLLDQTTDECENTVYMIETSFHIKSKGIFDYLFISS